MATTTYLDLDINNLFEQHTIKEIEEIQKKIQLESDRKKVELRTLVGERYRDLILAADTIGKMKVTSECVISRLASIEDKFRELQKKYLIGFKVESFENKLQSKSEDILDSIVIQIKILMDIPEHIWSAIDQQNLLFATQLFMVAQHINYSLSFEVGSTELTKKYPIVCKQWDIISQFKNIILNECNKILQLLDVSKENAANCLASLVFLNTTSLEDLLKKLITTRTQAIKSVIMDDSDTNVKNRIKCCIKILIQTITLVYACFRSHNTLEEGLVSQYVTKIKNLESYTLLSELELNKELLEMYLPSVTKTHKPFALEIAQSFSSSSIQTEVKSWLEWFKDFCNSKVTVLLDLIVSVKGLYSIREEIVSLDLPNNWNDMWKEIDLPEVNFWIEFFQPLITNRVKSIVSDKWAETLVKLKSDVIELLGKLVYEKYEFPENDLRWFVWKDSSADIPQKLTKNGEFDNKRPLLMKSKGYSPNIMKLCDNLDKNLSSLLLDLEQYLYETEQSVSLKDNLLPTNILLISDTFSDRAEIHQHLQKISLATIHDFVQFLNTECISTNPSYGRQDVNALIMARFLVALPLLCPNLNKCFLSPKSCISVANDSSWQSVCDYLKAESISIWTVWAKTYKANMLQHKHKLLVKGAFHALHIDMVISEWEQVTIEEEAGEGRRIKSEILIPYQPSILLQKFLTAVNGDLNKIIPHTIPKKVLQQIIENVVLEILDYYQSVSQSNDLRQKQALQALFDVKYIILLMIPRENKVLNDKSSEICGHILDKIDPFDYDVFSSFIQTNVKKSVQRSLLIFGNIVPHLEQLHSILGAREYNTGESGKVDPPAALAVCTSAPWFPPLAVTIPSRNLPLVSTVITEKTQINRKKATGKESSRNESASTTKKSGAAAFFGAMGSDWFGTT